MQSARRSNRSVSGHSAYSAPPAALLDGDERGLHQTEASEQERFVQELTRLIQAARDGRLSERGRAENFTGVYRSLVEGVNEMLDHIIKPLNVAAEYVDRISKGDLPPERVH
jgi:hypothetical protein